MLTRGRFLLLTLIAACSFTLCLRVEKLAAQVLYGSVTGTVMDQSGAVVPGAHVTVTNPKTGLKREADSNATGLFEIPNLPEGNYDLEVSAKGFKPVKHSGINVTVGTVVKQDVQLTVGAVTEEVTVQATGAALQTEKSDVGTQLTAVAVENLPTNIYRNYQSLLLLVPGAAANLGTTGAMADTPERALAIPMNGMDPASNSTRIDGAQSIFLWKPGGAALYVAPIESIQEVRITTNSFDPEKGMAGSAAMDVITKSGTNDLHGVLFWYHHDQHLVSCEPYDVACKAKAFAPPGTPGPFPAKPKDIINNPGGNLGGPIKKDKLFFFANWDGLFQRFTPDALYSVPTADERAGNFSRFLLGTQVHQCLAVDNNGNCTSVGPVILVPTTDGFGTIGPMVPLQQGMIFDPTTGNPDGTGRAVIAAGTTATTAGTLNVFPAGYPLFGTPAAATSQTILGLWPGPNFGSADPNCDPTVTGCGWSKDGEGNISHNFFENAPVRFNRNNFDFKVDWNRTEKHFLWFKYSAMKTLTANNCGFNSTIGGPCPADQWGRTPVLVNVGTIGHTWNLSPTLVADGTLGFSRMSQKGFPQDFGKNIGLTVLGIPGTNDPNDIRYSGAPTITVGGFDGLGSPNFGWMPFYRNDWTVTIAQNFSWMHGNHALRFGADIIHNHLNHWQPENGFGPRGGINFNVGKVMYHNFTDLCPPATCIGTVDGSGNNLQVGSENANSFAQFLTGIFDESGRSIQFLKANGKDWWYGFHFQDHWKLTPKLTANLGVRYEYYPLPTRDGLYHGLEQYDPTTNNYMLGGLGGNPRSLGVSTQKGLIGPRVGLAYQLDKNSVIRGGFGSTFDTYPILRELRGAFPAVISTDNPYLGSSAAGWETLGSCTSATSTSNLGQGTAPSGTNNLCDFQGLGSFTTGIPPVVPPAAIYTGTFQMPTNVDARYLGKGTLKRGRVETYNITAERRLPGDFLVSLGYVGNHMSHGWGMQDVNASAIDMPAPLCNATFCRTAVTNQLQGYLDSHYNSLQVTIDRHYAKGLYIKGAYTYSKAINMAYDTDAWGGNYWIPPLFPYPAYLSHNRGMADIDRRHIFRISYVWDIPVGPGHQLASSNMIGRTLFGGWQLNGVWSTTTGAPTSVFAPPGFYGASDSHQTLDQIGPIRKLGCKGVESGCFWYDPSSFAPVPFVNDPLAPPNSGLFQRRFGTTGRNIAIYGPGHSNMDASLFRHFKLSERYDLEFRAEAYNVFNHPTWGWSNNEWGGSNYCWGGGPTSDPCGGTFMQTVDDSGFPADGHRIITFGLRLAF